MKTGLLAVVLLLPTLAAAKTGNELLGDCSMALKLFNHENVSGEPFDFIKIGDCIGFVTGVMQAAALKKADPGNAQSKDANGQSKDPVPQFCARPDVSVEQLVRMSINRLKRKPEELNLDAAAVVLRALNESAAEPCIGSSDKQAEGLHWPDLPKKAHMRVRLVAVALALPRSSFFSNLEVLVAEKEIGVEEFSLIKLVFTYLPYQPPLSEAGFDYSVVHEVSAWRNPDCDETVAQLTTRSMPDRHEPMIYSRNAPRQDLDLRHIPLPCYETRADDYVRSSLEPVPPPPAALESAVRRKLTFEPPKPAEPVKPVEPTKPVLQTRPSPK
jgi:Rap1a immunity proteins